MVSAGRYANQRVREERKHSGANGYSRKRVRQARSAIFRRSQGDGHRQNPLFDEIQRAVERSERSMAWNGANSRLWQGRGRGGEGGSGKVYQDPKGEIGNWDKDNAND